MYAKVLNEIRLFDHALCTVLMFFFILTSTFVGILPFIIKIYENTDRDSEKSDNEKSQQETQ